MNAPRPQLHMHRALADLPPLAVPPDYALRALTPADVAAWVALMTRNAELGEWTTARAEPLFAGQMELDRSFVVEHDGEPVATAQLNPHSLDAYAPLPELGWVAVDPRHRGRSLGRAVCLAVLHAARDAGHHEIFLRTDDHRLPAIRIYLALGFQPWHRDDPEAAARWQAVGAPQP